ncbi:MAG TPA: methyltransferase domain-containing protein, partial [Longimicrobiaceae bacterium]
MTAVGLAEFERAYREALAGVWPHWSPGMQAEMARHCHGWSPERFDFRAYLDASAARFHRAYRALAEDASVRSVCDVGGFWGVFPLTLKRLGYEVAMTESLRYYSEAFRGLFDHVAAQGVEIVDYDPFEEGSPLAGSWDAVTVMAVLEHYPHSLRPFMENVVAGVRPGGMVFVEVPNIAFWPKRVSFLRGHSPHTPIGDVYRSAVPFIGHHHEFT